MSPPTATFVQFPHPREEHVPRGGRMAWNVGPHARKFLVSPGRYFDATGDRGEADLVFWAEWEPPSEVVRDWPAAGWRPRWLQRPYWVRPATAAYRQNTDPWVFGDRMLYSNCRQHSKGNANAMQRLHRGSVLCFGSTMDGEFCLDTVFVVASAEPWSPADGPADVEEAFTVCTVEAVGTGEAAAAACAPGGCAAPLGRRYTLYRGATVDDPVDGTFSFVPARRADDPHPSFARPAIHLPGLVNPRSTQSYNGTNRPRPLVEVRAAWEAVRVQVLAADLVLATHLETPERRGDEDVPSGGRGRC